MIYLFNKLVQKLSIILLKKANNKDRKEKKKITKDIKAITAVSDKKGDYTVYFMTDPNQSIIVQSILIHSNAYDSKQLIASSYIVRCWEYAMEGAQLWEIKGCTIDEALDIPYKLVIDQEIKQIVSSAYTTHN